VSAQARGRRGFPDVWAGVISSNISSYRDEVILGASGATVGSVPIAHDLAWGRRLAGGRA
jgi:hypothetical protein